MKKVFLLLILFIGLSAFGQVVPLNPDVMYGRLANGMTYYIQKNALPKERAMFYLVVNAGAINENEDQNGLAHFCEHMAFNGTKNFPGKGIINYLESIGVAFGRGVNAGTSSAMTTYTLNDIPTTRTGYIDSSLLILREWASNVSYTTDEINKERGVIHEEWRTYGGANSRMSKITSKVLFEGSKYSNHNVIGDIEVIDNADPDLLRSFYKEWYRPDLQAVLVVGDINRDEIKNKIEKIFGDIPARNDKPKNVRTLVAGNKDLKFTSATDKEAQGLRISFYVKHPGTETKGLPYYKDRLIFSLYNMMFSERVSELLQKENPPMISASAGYGSLTKFQDSFTTNVIALNNDPVRSFRSAITENERIKRYGFTAAELERAKSRMLASIERSFNEKDKQLSGSIIQGYVSHFTNGNPSPGISYTYELSKTFIPSVTLEQVNGLPAKWMTDNNQVIVITGPEKEGVLIPAETEIRSAFAEVLGSDISPYAEKVLPSSLISGELKGSQVIREEKIKDFDGLKWTLANGATVWFKYTDNKADEIMLHAVSYGGNSLIPPEDLPSASLASAAKNMCGLGDFSSQDLRRILAGKNAGTNVIVTELEEGVYGNSSVKDLETMLQLLYMQFMPVRHDDEVLKSMIQRSRLSMANRKANPNTPFSDTLSLLLTNYNPRTIIQDEDFLNRMNIEKAYSIANDRFKDAGDFYFVFVGNVDPEKMRPLVEKYIGSIPDDPRKESWIDHRYSPGKEHFIKKIYVEMKDPKAMNYIYFFGDMPYTSENVEYVNALRYILNMRYVESIREKEGGTYGVGVAASFNARPSNGFKISMSFTCAPERADYLRGLILDEVNNIRTKGVTEEEVDMTREYFLKDDEEKRKTNSFIMDRVKHYINNGFYTLLPEYSTDIYNNLDGKKIQEMANKVFLSDNYFEYVMMPKQ